MRKPSFGIRVLGAVLVLALASPLAGQVITADQQKRLYDYFNLNDKFYNASKQVIEGLMDDAPEFFGKYSDALAVVNVCNKFANAEDWEAFKGVVDIAESKIIEKIYKPYGSLIGWVSWAKTAMEMLNDFVVTPARMQFALDGYTQSRAAGSDPEEALSIMRDWGQVEMEMKKAMREQYGDQIFSQISPSGLTLLPAWQKRMEQYTKGWFEDQYGAKLQREAAEAFARTLNKTLEELAGYDAQMLQMLKEAAETKPESIFARPAQQTIKVGGSATFEIVGLLKDGTEEVLESKSFGGEGEYDKPGTVTVELTAAGLSCSARIIIVRDETPVSLAFRPESLTVAVGEKAEFDLRATYEDGKTGIVDVKTASYDKPGTYAVAGEYAGLTASATLVVVRNEKPAALFAQPESVTVKVGEKATLSAVARYEDGAEETVDVKMVTGRTVGTARVEFFFRGLSASATVVTVRDEKPVTLQFSPESAEIPVGEKVEFRLRATFADGKREVVGVQVGSSDKPGTYPISGEFGGLTAAATLVVTRNEKPVALSASPETATIKVGEKVTITGIARFADGAEETVSVATVEGRTVGSRRVEVFFQGLSAYATVVTVRDETPVSLDFSPQTLTVPPKEKAEFSLRATYADGKREVVGIQSVSQDKPGTYTITGEFGGLTAAATLIVLSEEKPESVAFVPQVVKVKVGEGGSYQVLARYKDGREQVVGGKPFPPYDKPGRHALNFEFMGLTAEGFILVLGAERKPSGLSFTPRDPTLSVGQAITLSLRASFQEGETTTTEVVDVVPVSFDKVGSYTVSRAYGGLTATSTITVIKEEKPTEVLVLPPTQTVEIGQKAVYAVVAVYESGERVVVKTDSFSQTDKPGTFPIKGSFYGVEFSGSVTVVEMRTAESVFLRPESQEVKLGGSATFELVVKYADGGSEILKRQAFEGTKVGTQSVFLESGTRSASGWLVVLPLGDVEKPDEKKDDEKDKDKNKTDNQEKDVDKALNEIKGDKDPCDPAVIKKTTESMTGAVNAGTKAAALIDGYYTKFMQIAGVKGSSGLCGNRMIAYCYANARSNLDALETALLEVEAKATEALMSYGLCPELVPNTSAATESIVKTISALRGAGPAARSKVAAMEGRLDESSCDKKEVILLGETVLPPNQDPDAIESGSNMVGDPSQWGGSCHDWGATAAMAKQAWGVDGRAEGQTGFDMGELRFSGDKDGIVSGPETGRGTYNMVGENIRIRYARTAVENGKRVTLTYAFVGTLSAQGRASGSYMVERSDGGARQSGSWSVQKRSAR